MSTPQPEKVGESRTYWTHKVDAFPSPVAQFRMAHLVDFDDRLYETARVVYRFLVGWYHDDHGDALLSQRHVAKVMKQRAPAGAIVPSRNAVQRAIVALMDTGWVVRTFKGRGKGKQGRGASRYVPVINVLELAAQGHFPELAHATGPVEPAHPNGPVSGPPSGPVSPQLAHANGPKTLLPDPVTKTRVRVVIDNSTPVAGGPLAAAPEDGFESVVAAYDKPDDNLHKARRAFKGIAPDETELERMVKAAASWRRTATGKRMTLERWLKERRWLSGAEFVNDNRPSFKWPSCVITRIKPRKDGDGDMGATVWWRDRNGDAQMRVLDHWEFDDLATNCREDRPSVERASDDLHEFVGARFQIFEDGEFGYYKQEAA